MSERPKMNKDRPTAAATAKPATVTDLESAIMNGGDKKKKRLILDISPELHKRIKRAALENDISMVDELTPLLESKYL